MIWEGDGDGDGGDERVDGVIGWSDDDLSRG